MSRGKRRGRTSRARAVPPGVEWESHPRIAPGVYHAYCKFAAFYRDPGFRRWTCLCRWEVLGGDLICVLASVPQWLSLGSGEKPRASRRGKYFPEWVRANGGPPARSDRLSPIVFVRRMARIEVRDTAGPAPYSVVGRILEWETGSPGSSVSRSHSQGEPLISQVRSDVSDDWWSRSSEGRDGVKGKPKRFSLPAPSEACPSHVRDKNVDQNEIESSSTSSYASALAGVEGEHTPAHTQGAGTQQTAYPPKAQETSGTVQKAPATVRISFEKGEQSES